MASNRSRAWRSLHQNSSCRTAEQQDYLGFFVIESDHGILPKTLGPAATDVPTDALFVDDTNLDQLSYFGVGWSTQGWVENFNNSLHLSDSTGSQVMFKFNGTAVWYFASQGADRGKLNVTLDGKQNWTVNANSPVTVQQKLLWSSPNVEYLPGTPPEKHKPPVGPIVGGVVGGLAFLVFICLSVLFYVRRYKSHENREYSTRARPAPPPLLNSGQPSRGSAAEPYMTQSVDGLNSPRAANLPIRRKGLVNTPPLNHQIESSAGTSYITGPSERTWPEGVYEESLPPAYQPAYSMAP
ncbi:hypothetical protein RhiLY_04886 [Ceratobasidium sp. AG-Ba]|nr:hypothetical protein RhiLY_04886 [Ceratobasidium sp. AG-Ba]